MSREDTRKGVSYGIAAYGMWGLVPIYFKAVVEVPALEVLAHRVVWSVAMLVPLVLLQGRLAELLRSLRDRRTLLVLMITTVFIASNWFLFIWAVATNRVLEASLGYFINPLVNVVLGVLFLGERLSRPAAMAVVLAGIGVAIQVVMIGSLPWLAIAVFTADQMRRSRS